MAVRHRAPAEALSGRVAGGVGLLLGAIAAVQFGAALGRTLFEELGPAGVALLRVAFGGAILLAVWRPSLRGHRPADLRLVLALGLVIGTMNLCVYEALDRLPLGVVVTIEFLGPLGVAVALSRRPVDFACAILAGAGVVLLAGPGGDVDAVGVALSLAAAACWAAYILLAGRVARAFRGASGVALAMLAGVLVPLGPGIAEAGAELLDPRWLAIGCAVGLLGSAVAYSLEAEALRRLPARVFGVLMSLEPAMAALAGLVVLGERLGLRQLAAIGLVVAASVGATRAAPALAPEA